MPKRKLDEDNENEEKENDNQELKKRNTRPSIKLDNFSYI